MKGMTLENIALACGGAYYGPDDLRSREISAVTTNNRAVTKGCLFAAIVGTRVDGHDFMREAADAGALCCLCQRAPALNEIPAIVVEATPEALKKIAAFYRGQLDIPFVGVTGSVGKTTTKEMIACVLSQRYKTQKTDKNLNNELGVPLTLFSVAQEHECAVVEMGISDFGEMLRLAEMVRPDIAVFTAIGYSHIEFLKSRAGVLKAKTELLEYMTDDGVVILNGDDDMLSGLQCRQNRMSYGVGNACDVRAENIHAMGIGGTSFDFVSPMGSVHVEISAFGDHMIYAALAAACVGIICGLTGEEIAAGISGYKVVGRRSDIIDTGYITIIDDCYNSNPTSCASAIRSLSRIEGRRVAVLGDMLDLGDGTQGLHRDIGKTAANMGVDLVLTAGTLSKEISRGAQGGTGGIATRHFSTKRELIDSLNHLIQKDDIVLVKASHSCGFEEVTEALKLIGG